MTESTLTLTRPDDWHLHLRDGDLMRSVVGATARIFGRAVVMPNLRPPVTTVDVAAAYRERIAAALPKGSRFAPLLTLYLTDHTSAQEVTRAKRSGFIVGAKYYPAGATTHSDSGVTDIARAYPALEAMQREGLPLLVHGEVTDPDVDIFDRESAFVDRVLSRVVRDFPSLRVVLEHVTTTEAVDFVVAAPAPRRRGARKEAQRAVGRDRKLAEEDRVQRGHDRQRGERGEDPARHARRRIAAAATPMSAAESRLIHAPARIPGGA